jgi:hypothetical protein
VKRLLIAFACLALPAVGGCTWMLGLEDVAPNATDAGAADAARDVSSDQRSGDADASADVSVDANDGSVDASVDASDDATDASVDASIDAGEDVAPIDDASADADAAPIDVAPYDAPADAPGEADATPIDAGPPTLPCVVGMALPLGSPAATGSTTDRSDTARGTCVSGTGNDIAFEWVAPYDDWYSIDTFGSSFDTVLYLRDAACDGPELACSDNAGGTTQSEIIRQFTKGRRVAIYVDGKANDKGSVVVNIKRITCPTNDITGQPLPLLQLSTVGGPNTHTGVCGGNGFPERAYRYVPSVAGLYSITAKSTAFKPVIYVEQGARCGGTLLGCNTGLVLGAAAASRYPAEVIRKLPAGQPVTIIVDGADGSGFFDLNIVRIDDGSTCGSATLPPNDTPVNMGAGGPNHQTATCSTAGGSDMWGGPMVREDHTYKLDINHGATTFCQYVFTANGPFTVYRVRGQCEGPEVACIPSTDKGGSSYEVQFGLGAADNGSYTLVIENAGPMSITYSVRVMCVA